MPFPFEKNTHFLFIAFKFTILQKKLCPINPTAQRAKPLNPAIFPYRRSFQQRLYHRILILIDIRQKSMNGRGSLTSDRGEK